MVTQETLPAPGLMAEEYVPGGLFDDAPAIKDAPVTGHWFPIRLTPDLAAGEMFNVGVGFIDDTGQLHTKLLENANAFKCIYGQAGQENFNFLLTIIKQHFSQVNVPISPSPHIRLGPQAFVSGSHPESIIKNLYDTMVSLRCDDESSSVAASQIAISTETVRKRLFGLMKKEAPKIYERLHRETPVRLFDKQQNPLLLDLPIWNEHPDLYHSKGTRFGTIVSAHYRDKVYRNYNLDGGSLNILNAAMILSEKNVEGGLFILRPAEGTTGYDSQMITAVENDIDRAVWAVQQRKNVKVIVSPDVHRLMHASLELAS